MSDNVIRLPRNRQARPLIERLGLYLRVGRNQHRELQEVLGSGERGFHGLVFDAGNVERQAELMSQATQYQLDTVLDPKTHAMALPGGHNANMANLPWGLERPHTIADFSGYEGRQRSDQLAEFAVEHGFTQLLGPTHLLSSANDRWLRHDIVNMGHIRSALDSQSSPIQLIYPVAISMNVLRDALQRSAIIAALSDAPMDMIWLKVENFGSDATGEKTVAYVQAAREFQALGVPVVADHAGGLSGLGLLAFGAVGGIAHGITLLEGFKASAWRRPPQEGRRGGIPPTRVYIPRLDLHMKREEAEAFLNSSTRTKGLYGCRDTHCCPGGFRDMLNHPTRHFVHQRTDQVSGISSTPDSLRVSTYLEQMVRPVSDNLTAVVGLGAIEDSTRKKLLKKQTSIGRFRQSIGHFADADSLVTNAIVPRTLTERNQR